MVARRAHNPEVAGSSPVPATREKPVTFVIGFLFFNMVISSIKYFVYVIKSAEGYHYTGMTQDLDLRIKQHNNKTLSFWTKRGTNWKIIYVESFSYKSDALKREKWLKSGVGREFLKNSVKNY